jgi:hypothetical protein
MILKLRNNKVIIENSQEPENANKVYISYDYELGTNHLTPKLTINENTYFGNNIYIPIDINTNCIDIKVELLDTRKRVIHRYTNTLQYYKMCAIGDVDTLDIYTRYEKLKKEFEKLKEKGDVI